MLEVKGHTSSSMCWLRHPRRRWGVEVRLLLYHIFAQSLRISKIEIQKDTNAPTPSREIHPLALLFRNPSTYWLQEKG